MMLPSLFVSHGSPMLALEDVPARDFLRGLARRFARPRAILGVSAHWETDRPAVSRVEQNDTIHDFYGFPEALYRLSYPAPGSAWLAGRVRDLLDGSGIDCAVDPRRGLDHGAWVPLLLAYPQADVPVVQLSIQTHLGPAHHLALGRVLAPLRAEGVLILGSGSFTHNLGEFRRHGQAAASPGWVEDFAAWMDDAIGAARVQDLLDYRRLAPHAVMNHPTDEHLLPLFVALGAAGDRPASERLHASVTYGILRMDAYSFWRAGDRLDVA
jgi:4,5-DOPA dioxygenase extradiol